MAMEIDRTTGDLNHCVEVLKRFKVTQKELYCEFKQYWILVYIVGMDLDSLEDCLSIPEEVRLEKIRIFYPQGLKYFSQTFLYNLLKLPDDDLQKITKVLWKNLPFEIVLDRVLKSHNPQDFFNADVKIDKLPESSSLNSSSLRTFISLASPELLPNVLTSYFQTCCQEFIQEKVENCFNIGQGITLDNFRLVKAFMKNEDPSGLSLKFCSLSQNILANFLAPPVMSGKLLPFEMEEILNDLEKKDLAKVKSFVFSAPVAFDVRLKMSQIFSSLGVDCEEEEKLMQKKATCIGKMSEEAGLELLLCRSVEEVEDRVLLWKKENLFNTFR
jgi:hypothetical protein